MNESLKTWVKINDLKIEKHSDESNFIEITGVGFFLILSDKERVFDKEMNLIFEILEMEAVLSGKFSYVLFEFGSRWYYTKINFEKFIRQETLQIEFNDFKYFGRNKKELSEIDEIGFAFLGVHTEYELYNGGGLSSEWARKAIFYGHKALGICDKNTLGGTLAHQIACENVGIKSILGETVSVAYDYLDDTAKTPLLYDIKLYVTNETGWHNILKINKEINVVNGEFYRFIDETELFKYADGLVVVFSKDSYINKNKSIKELKNHVEKYKKHFKRIYYQLDSVKFFDDSAYKNYAEGILKYLKYFSKTLKPILISDAYYLDQEGAISRKYLNDIAGFRHSFSDDEFYKPVSKQLKDFYENYDISEQKFENGLNFYDTILTALASAATLQNICNYKIEVGESRIPAFEYDGDKNELLWDLIIKGYKDKIVKDKTKRNKKEEYLERIKTEWEVVVPAGLTDYFLIHWDFVKHIKNKDELVGVGRGSVGGCLVSYLLDITDIDPIVYDLLFERFLNPTRVAPQDIIYITLDNGEKYRIPKEDFPDFDPNKNDMIDDKFYSNIEAYKV